MYLQTTLLLLSATTAVSAHGFIDTYLISNKTYTGFNPSAAPWVPDQGTIAWPSWNDNTGPVYSSAVNTTDIICSINATNPKISSIPITAGDTLSLHWTPWPDSHHGPIFSYLAACNGDCTLIPKETLKWFKIAELGQISLGAGSGIPGIWAADQLRAQNGTWNVTLPSSIKAGNYVLRHEILALHSAYDVGAAQFYPTCVNIVIQGGGNVVPEGTMGTKLYDANDKGVHYGIYNDETKPVYPMPGPALFVD